MNKIGIVVRREFGYRVKKRSFIILTILMPFLMAAVIMVPMLLSSLKGEDLKQVVVVDRTGIYAPCFKSDGNFKYIIGDRMRSEYREEENETYAVVSIWDDLAKDPTAARIYSKKEVSSDLLRAVNNVLGQKIKDQKLSAFNVPGLNEVVKQCEEGYEIRTVKWSDNGDEKESNTDVAMFVGIFFTILIYMFVLSYGTMVMQSVTEEKSNRIVELMVSSVKPFTLMMGKIIGVALVGLLQMLIWGVMLFVILGIVGVAFGIGDVSLLGAGGMNAMGTDAVQNVDAAQIFQALGGMNFVEIILMVVVYFIGGYLLYASFFAGVGSAINSSEDTGQFVAPTMVVMAFALYAGMFSIENPDGSLAFWCSMIPFTSPIVMMVRIPFGVPLWQELLSVVLLYFTAISMVWIAGRI